MPRAEAGTRKKPHKAVAIFVMGFARSLVQRVILAGVLSHAWGARAAVYTDASQLPTDTFDFVIVGGVFYT